MGIQSTARLPARLNLVTLVFLPVDDEETLYDKKFKQPIRVKKRKTKVELQGQMNFGSNQKKFFDRLMQSLSVGWNTMGDLADTIGHCVTTPYLTERAKFLPEGGEPYYGKYIPKKGDLLIGYADFVPEKGGGFDLLVEQVRPESPLRGNPLLLYIDLRQNRNKR